MDRHACEACTPLLPCIEHDEVVEHREIEVRAAERVDTTRRQRELDAPQRLPAGGTRRDLVPLCAHHHREQHDTGVETFATRYQVDLAALAASVAADLDARGVP